MAIRRLEKIGLVKRSRDPSDLRAVLVDITHRTLRSASRWPTGTPPGAMLDQLPSTSKP
ncbi:marR family protein [Mycobacterium ulcerans str. Harvey]|uniref:MarR family protein n=1 Tax=Mycobacterium ulcerans str. Harvey TaxID=1299332 RepID=A0ABN0R9X7_MYCUL|nr:marR family protein [Mycobacterium ulcerans str. Harvey]